jgi:hypothetical protein
MDDTIQPPHIPSPPPQPLTVKRRRISDSVEASRSGAHSTPSLWSGRVMNTADAVATIPSDHTSVSQPPSRAPSRSKSVRTRRIQLQYSDPPIFFGPPETYGNWTKKGDSESAANKYDHADESESIPDTVCEVARRFSEEAANPSFESGMMSVIRALSPLESMPCPGNNANTPYTTDEVRMLLPHVSKIFSIAQDLYAGSYEENSWYPLVREVLDDPPHLRCLHQFFKVEESQSRSIHSELLPCEAGKPISTVKVDQVLQFNAHHPDIIPVFRPVFRSQSSSFSLSAFNDPAAAKTSTAAALEVKPPTGNFAEASYQLAVASAAILERMRTLDQEASEQFEMPVVGWIVHGHFWTLHVSYRCNDGSIVWSPCIFPRSTGL